MFNILQEDMVKEELHVNDELALVTSEQSWPTFSELTFAAATCTLTGKSTASVALPWMGGTIDCVYNQIVCFGKWPWTVGWNVYDGFLLTMLPTTINVCDSTQMTTLIKVVNDIGARDYMFTRRVHTPINLRTSTELTVKSLLLSTVKYLFGLGSTLTDHDKTIAGNWVKYGYTVTIKCENR